MPTIMGTKFTEEHKRNIGLSRLGKVYVSKKEKVCKECGVKFIPKTHSGTKQYCSYACSNKVMARKRMEKAAETRICQKCKKEYTRAKSRYPKTYGGKFCSRKCWVKSIGRVDIRHWKRKVWSVFSLYIRNRDNWTCITCGKVATGMAMHGGHFVPRTHNSTYFDEMNVHAQCAGCNMFGNGEPHLYAEKLISMYGEDEFNALIKRSRELKSFTYEELKGMYDHYKKLV